MAKPIHVRVEDDLRGDFDAALQLTGLGETQFVKAALKAFVEYVRENREITVPLAILPKSAIQKKTRPAYEKGEADDTRAFSLNETPKTHESAPPSELPSPTARPTADDVRKAKSKLIKMPPSHDAKTVRARPESRQ